MSTKLKYEIDPHNRLTAQGPYRYRHVLDGQFKMEDGNRLVYHVKKSDLKDVPQEIRFSGAWSMDEKHRLILTLDKWNNQVEGNKLVLKSELIDAGGNELAFTAGTRCTDGSEHVSLLKLAGTWKADAHNQFVFSVEKEGGVKDELTFRGVWELNKNNEIEYITIKRLHSDNSILRFRGHWDIPGNNRLSYILSEDGKSCFDLKIEMKRVTRGSIDGFIGIGVAPLRKKITIFGKWRPGEGLCRFP
jgi:hypothetical protein